ncbi:MAG: hypothetical protein ABIH25_04285 [Candidatus Woesearchaeota archaeon]
MAKFTYKECLNRYVRVFDKGGSSFNGFLKEGNFERIVLEPVVADVSENPFNPDYQLDDIFILPFADVHGIMPVTEERIRNVLIPAFNRLNGSGTQNSLYVLPEKETYQLEINFGDEKC